MTSEKDRKEHLRYFHPTKVQKSNALKFGLRLEEKENCTSIPALKTVRLTGKKRKLIDISQFSSMKQLENLKEPSNKTELIECYKSFRIPIEEKNERVLKKRKTDDDLTNSEFKFSVGEKEKWEKQFFNLSKFKYTRISSKIKQGFANSKLKCNNSCCQKLINDEGFWICYSCFKLSGKKKYRVYCLGCGEPVLRTLNGLRVYKCSECKNLKKVRKKA